MQAPLEITFRGMEPSPFVEAACAAWLERLEHVFERIQHCHVRLDLPHRRRRGLPFLVTLTLSVPGHDSVVAHCERSDVYLAIADVFLTARRRLRDIAQIQRGEVKHHAALAGSRHRGEAAVDSVAPPS